VIYRRSEADYERKSTDIIMEKNMTTVPRLKYFVDGQWRVSQTERYMDVYNPSTGEVMAQAPCCTEQEVLDAVAAARKAFPAWSDTPAIKRSQIMFRVRELLIQHQDR